MKLESARARDGRGRPELPQCEQCDGRLTVPEWSERVSEHCIRHLWACEACGYQFERSVYFAKN